MNLQNKPMNDHLQIIPIYDCNGSEIEVADKARDKANDKTR